MIKKYAGTEITQNENYSTELLAGLLNQLPNYRQFILNELYLVTLTEGVVVKTQDTYQTQRFGKAILDLTIEDNAHFIITEVKVDSRINIYQSQDDLDKEVYDQIQKYEDCIGLPEHKNILIFTITKHPVKIGQ
ncbi:hypothetical protein ACFLVX_03680 [Chloroflexota bacterium]